MLVANQQLLSPEKHFNMKDLFEHYNELPESILAILEKHKWGDENYQTIEAMQRELNANGYKFDYYLDAIPYNLRKMSIMNKEDFIKNRKTWTLEDYLKIVPDCDEDIMQYDIIEQYGIYWIGHVNNRYYVHYPISEVEDFSNIQDAETCLWLKFVQYEENPGRLSQQRAKALLELYDVEKERLRSKIELDKAIVVMNEFFEQRKIEYSFEIQILKNSVNFIRELITGEKKFNDEIPELYPYKHFEMYLVAETDNGCMRVMEMNDMPEDTNELFWTVYGIDYDGLSTAIADFRNKKEAKNLLELLTSMKNSVSC
jgi:hypothetical protein